MQLTPLNWLLAFTPIVVVLVLMLVFHWGGSKAGAMSWFFTVLVAAIHFGAGPEVIAYSQVKAILLALDVTYIVWAALLLFHTANEAGAIALIGRMLPQLSPEITLQALLIGWLFASFLQSLGGLGVPTAVTAPILIGLGFTPIQSVIMASIGHGWIVTFGSMGTSFQTLIAVTNHPGDFFASPIAILLGIASIPSAYIVAYIAGGKEGLRQQFLPITLVSTIMTIVLFIMANTNAWSLAATCATIIGLITWIIYIKNKRDVIESTSVSTQNSEQNNNPATDSVRRTLPVAMSAYITLVLIAFVIKLIKPINDFASQVKITMAFPELKTALGWTTPAGLGRQINVFGHTGAILVYASLIAFVVYSLFGYYQPRAARRILTKVVRSATMSSLGVIAMVSVATLMSHSGMTNILAEGLSKTVGQLFYPALSPFIGFLGAFITGSNSNSNVLFALLQERTAELLGLSAPLILATQTAGASIGSILAPAKVIVGCSTAGLAGKEGDVLRKMIFLGIIPIAVVAIAATLWAKFF